MRDESDLSVSVFVVTLFYWCDNPVFRFEVADAVTMSGGPIVQRIRLQEEAENQVTGQSMMMDDDLLQYYHFLADKGDVQAQVVLGQLYFQGGRGVGINHEVSTGSMWHPQIL